MALPGSGIIALTDISTEFGGTAPHALSEYYRDGVYSDGINIPAGETSIPASGPISFSNFYGTSAVIPATYSLTPSTTIPNEGDAVVFTFGGANLLDGTVYFSIVHGTTSNADFTVTPPLDGSRTAVTITSGVYSPTSVSLTLDADLFTDGSSETFTAYVHDANTGGTELATSGVITVADTSLTPVISYDSAAFSPTAINEDGVTNTTFTVNTSNVVNGTTVGYTITGVTTADISLGSLTGNITITGNTGTVVFNAIADATTEGTEVATLTLAATDSVGTGTGSLSDSVTINDTSLTPVGAAMPLAPYSVTSVAFSGSCTAGIEIFNTGTINSSGLGNPLTAIGLPDTWLVSGVASDYDVRFDYTTSFAGGGTISVDAGDNVWLNLGTTREWQIEDSSATAGANTMSGLMEIRDAGTLVVLASGNVTLSADFEP